MSGNEHAFGSEIHLYKKCRRYWMRHENLFRDMQIQFLDNLGFSGYAVPLHVIVVIFEEG